VASPGAGSALSRETSGFSSDVDVFRIGKPKIRDTPLPLYYIRNLHPPLLMQETADEQNMMRRDHASIYDPKKKRKPGKQLFPLHPRQEALVLIHPLPL